ncbi:MAG: hypothetical protein O7G88_08130, partial [bacterium]|nr:hypothetical protein [bacterium]
MSFADRRTDGESGHGIRGIEEKKLRDAGDFSPLLMVQAAIRTHANFARGVSMGGVTVRTTRRQWARCARPDCAHLLPSGAPVTMLY